MAIHTFYPLVARVAAARGLDPDVPRHLSKVTRTSWPRVMLPLAFVSDVY
jgi:hypothetical protein